ncbi:amino acid adenylation domain-containing protein [Roseivirga sp. BDSF3-8]|uniref:amino acid adenylation domain-containing protein n=1 Tax=Roseivirga sp. BDSF3-8 TaxID=3241598 RepID=UPI003531DCE9
MNRDIAIIGMAGRFPEAPDLDAFYRNLEQGRDSVRPLSLRRKVNTGIPQDKDFQVLGFMEDIDLFDHDFFGMSAGEARSLDPHQRQLLETVYHAIENAGYAPRSLSGSRTAVFIGDTNQQYAHLSRYEDPMLEIGSLNATLAGRIARFFNLQGTALMVDTACSSSLVALHMAVNELVLGDADQALVCGVSISLFQGEPGEDENGVMSQSGKSKTFSAEADGIGVGEASACVLIKSLAQAEQDGDHIWAVIKGSAINQDAARSSSLSAPSWEAQSQVMQEAWRKAGIDPANIGFIEAHGTGTKLGDPIEIQAISEALSRHTSRKQFCAVSSAKANIGHADTAAGITGLFRAVLALHHNVLFPAVHFHEPNPLIDFANSPVFVPDTALRWESDRKRLAGVSSFGVSGTNCHVVLQEASNTRGEAVKEEYPVILSGKTAEGLTKQALQLKKYLQDHPDISLADLSHTLATGRDAFCYRALAKADSVKDLIEKLNALESRETETPESVWMVCSPAMQLSEKAFSDLAGTFPQFDEVWKVYKETGNHPQAAEWRAILYRVALYRLLDEAGLASRNLMGLAEGKLAVSIIKGEKTYEEASALLSDSVADNTGEEKLKEKLEGFAQQKLKGHHLVIELGAEGLISHLLKEIRSENQAEFTVIHTTDTSPQAIRNMAGEAWYAGMNSNWKLLFTGSHGKLPLPGYAFAPVRCWLDDEAQTSYESPAQWTYQRVQEEKALEDPAATSPLIGRNYLFISNSETTAGELAVQLAEACHSSIQVQWGEAYRQLSDRQFILSIASEEDIIKLHQVFDNEGIDLKGIVFLYHTASEFDSQKALQYAFAQALIIKHFAHKLRLPDFHMANLRIGRKDISGFTTLVHSGQALSRSLLSDFIGLNVHDITCLGDSGTHLADQLQKELASTETVRFVTLRGEKRYVEKLQLAPADLSEGPLWEPKAGAHYLVAGGARGAAFEVIKHIAARTPSHFIVLGRSEINGSDERADNLERLKTFGSTITYLRADIADEQEMMAVEARLLEDFGSVDYVINAAGTAPRVSWENLDTDTLIEHTEAKTRGTRLLHQLAMKLGAKKHVLFSSLNTLFPDRHSFTYSLACAWQDGYALEQDTKAITSINWGIWAETNEDLKVGDHESPILPFATYKGKKGFDLALSRDLGNFAFADLALERMAVNPFYLVEEEGTRLPVQTARPAAETEDLSSGEEKLLSIWKDVLRNPALSADDNFFQVGGHSLIAIRIINLIRKAFSVSIEFRHMLEYPTVRKLAIFLQGLADTSSRSAAYAAITPAPAAADYPLSHAQKRLWILDQLENLGHAYVVPRAYTFRGDISPQAFEQAFSEMVKRHESFRTTFTLRDGEPRQVIHAKAEPFTDFRVIDLKNESQAEDKTLEIATTEAASTFDLEKGPLLRGRLILLNGHTSVLVYTMHHIISDEWSLNVFRTELTALYREYAGGEKAGLPTLPIHYKDFAVWQNNLLSATGDSHKEYWMQQFSGTLPVLQLPADFARPASITFSGDALAKAPDKLLLDRLNAYGQERGLSLFMVLMSAIKVLFYRYTGQQDLILGTPVAGRDHDELEEQIGYYVNTLAIRTQLDPEAPFEQIAREVKENVLQAFEHQVYPFDKIVEDLQPETPAGHRPLFDTMVLLQNAESTDKEETKLYGDVQVENFSYGKDVSKFDLTFEFTEHPGGLSLYIEYNSDLFRKERIKQMAGHLWHLLNEVASGVEVALKDIALLTEEEKTRLLHGSGKAEATYPENETIVTLFGKQAELRSNDTALLFGSEKLSYRELDAQANQIANFLLNEINIKPDDRVGLMMPRGTGMVVAIMGILKSGGAYLPIDPDYPQERKQFIVQDASPKVILTDGNVKDMPEMACPQLDIRSETITSSPATAPAVSIGPDDLAYIIYTSGSTGTPKGVMIGHRKVVRLLFSEGYPFSFSERDTWITLHSISFDFSVWEIFGPLLTGGKLVVATQDDMRSPANVLNLLQKHEVTVLNQTPTVFSRLTSEILNKPETPELALRYVIFGGEALNPASLTGFHKAFPQTLLVNMYGITETTVHVTYKEIGRQEIENGTSNIGKPLPTLDVLILDENGRLVPEGVAGEIAVEGAGLARGYFNRPELTAQRFAPHPYKKGERIYLSGDLGMRGFDGDLYYFGRKDKQVKIRGYRIELGEIEHSLLRHESVNQALVTVRDDEEDRKQLVAYCTGTEALTYAGLKAHLRGFLPDYMVPAYFVQVEEIHYNANGKADLSRLPDPLSAGLQNDEYVAPQNQMEEQLLGIFSDALKNEHLGTRHNFFAAGGDSIKAIRLAGQIGSQMGKGVAVKDIYMYPDVTSLATYLSDSGATDTRNQEGHEEIERVKAEIVADAEQVKKLPEGWQDFYPMSAVEKGMLFYNQLYADQHVFHDQFFYPFVLDSLDFHRFEQAFHLLVKKHEILRTSFHTTGFAQPIQVVHPAEKISGRITFTQVNTKHEPALEEYFEEQLAKDRQHPFQPEKPGLWRMILYALQDNQYVLLWVFHHAIMDGWSNASLMTELLDTYAALESNVEPDLKPLATTYKDYVAGELQALRSEETRDFWQDKLSGAEKCLLPYDRSADDEAMQQGLAHYRFKLPEETGIRLTKLAADQKTGVKEVLIGAFLYFLRFSTTGRDLVVGLIGNGRPEQPDGDKVMGCFLNSLPLRIQAGDLVNGRQLTRAVADEMLAIKPYEKFPLLEMAGLAGVAAGQGGNAFFDIVFNYVDFHVYDEAGAELEDSSLELNNHEVADTPFDLTIRREGDIFHCQFAYPGALYALEEVERLSRYFTRIAGQIAFHPDKTITASDLLDQSELQQIVHAFNDTNVDLEPNQTVTDLLEKQVSTYPDKVALAGRNHTLTYKEFNEQVNQLAYFLRHKVKVGTGDLMAFAFQDNQSAVLAIWAILKAGGAYLPLAADTPADRVKAILKQAKPVALLTDLDHIEADCPVINTREDAELILAEKQTNPDKKHSGNDPAYVIFTSGSTGVPKGVMVSHSSLTNMALDHIRVHGITHEDRMLQFASFTFDASLVEITMALLSGAGLVLTDKELIESPDILAAYMEEKRVTFVSMPVSYFNMLPLNKVPTLRAVLAGGEAADVAIASEASRQLRYWNAYGPTECCVITSRYEVQPADQQRKSMPIGKPVSNTRVYILDDRLQLTPHGLTGELCVAGTGLALGYLNDKELTESKFTESPYLPGEPLYRTGDYARWLPDGNLEFVGRKDRQVKVNGFRIETGEIVRVLMQHDQVRQAVVDVQSPTQGVKYLIAWIVPDAKNLETGSLREHVAAKLPAYMVPARFVVIDEVPLTAHGKVDYKELKQVAARTAHSEAPDKDIVPGNALETSLLAIWRELFADPDLQVTDNFFAAGGNSISALQMISRISETLGIQVPVRLAFTCPTIRQLASKLAALRPETGLPAIRPVPQQDYYEASRAQWRFWTMDQMSPGSLNYVINNVYRINGNLQHSALEQAAQSLIERHEILRTGLILKSGKLVQDVQSADEVLFAIPRFDARSNDSHPFELIDELTNTPFNLKEAPLIRISRVDVGENECLLVVSLHHVITDGWSMVVFMRELTRLYESYVTEEGEPLTPLLIQYKDYAAWHNELLHSDLMARQKAFWENHFAGFVYTENGLIGKERMAGTGMEGDRVKYAFSTGLTDSFTAFCNRRSVTPFMTVMAAVNAACRAVSGQQDTVIGTSVTGRSKKVLEDQIGCYLNNLAIRVVQEDDETFASLLQKTEDSCHGAYANEQYPFDKVVNDLDVPVQPDRFPLMDIALLWDNDSEAIAQMSPSGLEIEEITAGPVISNMDLRFIFSDQEGRLALTIEYKKDFFEKEEIDNLFNLLETILEQGMNDPQIRISQFDNGSLSPEGEGNMTDIDTQFNF